ncbi:hypothetical protein GXW83_20130 [Streptacidiphilus sp. PB12-B1b]|uniref:hypothetical protein n=1 Tax=Streptacidiphilus sp. PB12-B1b TaxID=2705012 RepID=UPI0015FBC45E|nr:hypothetical protein [Streptacidiphilus sp. PB12-B1b]QMU74406.1 hypothetical protein GXW83_20130 [Streptacidiphilus sp. PB12-B1b]
MLITICAADAAPEPLADAIGEALELLAAAGDLVLEDEPELEHPARGINNNPSSRAI